MHQRSTSRRSFIGVMPPFKLAPGDIRKWYIRDAIENSVVNTNIIKGIVMIPFGDMLNHHDEACGVHFGEVMPLSTIGMSLRASRDIATGEEVYANYGPRRYAIIRSCTAVMKGIYSTYQSDEKTLFSYGYVPDANKFNFLPLNETNEGLM